MRLIAAVAVLVAQAMLSPSLTAQIVQPARPDSLVLLPVTPSIDALRLTGPLCDRNFNRIKLALNGQTANLIFVNYLTTPVGAFLTRYKPNWLTFATTLPPDFSTNAAVIPRHVPGQYPTADGIHDMRLELGCVRYSARYGGSLQLLFNAEETFEYDARFGSTLWDMEDLEVSVFVVPQPGRFNTATATIGGGETAYLEARPRILVAYKVLGAPSAIERDSANQRIRFDSLWHTVASSILSPGFQNPFRAAAGALVHGLVHYLYRSQLTGANRVAMMELDERLLEVTTVAGTPTVSIQVGVSDIDLSEGTFQTGQTLRLQARASWDASFADGELFDLEDRTSISPRSFFSFPLSSCPTTGVPTIDITGTYKETHPFTDNSASIGKTSFPINCGQLVADATQSLWGPRAVDDRSFAEVNEDGEQVGSAKLVLRVYLNNR